MRKIFGWHNACKSKVFKYFLKFIKLMFIKFHALQIFLELRGLLECIFVIRFLPHLIQRLLT